MKKLLLSPVKAFAQILLILTLSVFTANMLKQVFSFQKIEQGLTEKDVDDTEDDSENDDDETRIEIEWFFIEQHSSEEALAIHLTQRKMNVAYKLSLIVPPYSQFDAEPPEC